MSTDQALAHIREFYDEVINKQNPAAVDDFFHAEYRNYGPDPDPGVATREQLKRFFEELFRAFPDMRVSIHEPVASGDLVAWRGVIEATHLGEFMGVPPTGRRVTIEEYHIERMRDGLMAEHWGLFDKVALLQQLGVMPSAAA